MARCTAWTISKSGHYVHGRCRVGYPLWKVKNGKRTELVCRCHRMEYEKYGASMFKRRPKDWEKPDGWTGVNIEFRLPGDRQ